MRTPRAPGTRGTQAAWTAFPGPVPDALPSPGSLAEPGPLGGRRGGMRIREGGNPANLDPDFHPPKFAGVPSISGRGPVLHWLHPGLPLRRHGTL